jgi:hypothetical protein
MQELAVRPDLIELAVTCKEDSADTLRWHENRKLVDVVEEMVAHTFSAKKYPPIVRLLLNSEKQAILDFFSDGDLTTDLDLYTTLHDYSWVPPGDLCIRLLDEIFKTGEGSLRYMDNLTTMSQSVHHIPLDSLVATPESHGDIIRAYKNINHMLIHLKEDLSKFSTCLDENANDLNLICPTWMYSGDSQSPVYIQKLASDYDILQSKKAEYRIGAENIKSFLQSVKERWKSC